jgi:hypothetical protein
MRRAATHTNVLRNHHCSRHRRAAERERTGTEEQKTAGRQQEDTDYVEKPVRGLRQGAIPESGAGGASMYTIEPDTMAAECSSILMSNREYHHKQLFLLNILLANHAHESCACAVIPTGAAMV